jgi:hypothetical protein
VGEKTGQSQDDNDDPETEIKDDEEGPHPVDGRFQRFPVRQVSPVQREGEVDEEGKAHPPEKEYQRTYKEKQPQLKQGDGDVRMLKKRKNFQDHSLPCS